jgi:hypothetical protein
MTTGYVYFAEDVARDTLSDWLKTRFAEGCYRLGMRPDDTDLSRFVPTNAAEEVALWPQVRVFDTRQEMRWQQHGTVYAVWLLTETPPPSPPSGLAEVRPDGEGAWTAVAGAPPLYLWGSYNEAWSEREGRPTWIETRIARPLHHPALPPRKSADTEKLFARLGHIEYRAPNGAAQFTRLTEVT